MKKYPLIIDPPCKSSVWGGKKLTEYYGGDRIAEANVLSLLEGEESYISNGSLKGRPLTKVFVDYPDWIVDNLQKKFPIMIKLAETTDFTSVQVHPNDAFAISKLKCFGKSEIWYIIEADENAGVYVGFNEELTKEDVKRLATQGKLLEKMRFSNVKKGDVVEIPAGYAHTITGGVTFLAIQENSNVEYRLYDFDRADETRPLDIDKALEVIELEKADDCHVKIPMILDKKITYKKEFCPYFTFYRYKVTGEFFINNESLTWIMPLDNELKIEYARMGKIQEEMVGKLRAVIIPCGLHVKLTGDCEVIRIQR